MYLTKEQCEVKRFKRKPFLKILADIVLNKISFFAVCLFILSYGLFMFLMGIPFKMEMIMPPVFVFFFSPITTYFEQYSNINILTGNIQKIYVSKSRKIMRIHYIGSIIGRMRIRIIYMPDADSAKQYIINQLNERNLFVIDKKVIFKK
jgi:hypothetical protein